MNPVKTMYKITLGLFSFFLVSCKETNVDIKNTEYVIQYGDNPLRVVTLDGCEYIYGGTGQSQMITHKGNCSNPIHYENKGYE